MGGGSSHGARGFDSLSMWHLSLQADGRRRKAVLRVELVFGPEEQLALFPSPQELEACLLGALDTVVESVLLVGGGACLGLATGGDGRGGGSVAILRAVCSPQVTRINSETPRTPEQLPQAVSALQGDPAYLSGGELRWGRPSLGRGLPPSLVLIGSFFWQLSRGRRPCLGRSPSWCTTWT